MDNRQHQRSITASRLRTAREMAGLSQGQVAKLLSLHRPSISEIEAGRRRVAVEELTAFAAAYGVSAAWLSGEDVASADPHRDRIELAARELQKLTPEDLERVLRIVEAIRAASTPKK